jgi:hypothetical protein
MVCSVLTSVPVAPDSPTPRSAVWHLPPVACVPDDGLSENHAPVRTKTSLPDHVAMLLLAYALHLQSRLLLQNPGKTCVLSGTGTKRPVPGARCPVPGSGFRVP